MATQILEPTEVDLSTSRRTLLLIWQNSSTRRFIKVGQFDALTDGRFAFRYLDGAWDDPTFQPLVEFPERGCVYVSDELPAFFANRVLSADRSNFDEYLGWLGLEARSGADLPLEVLARTGGGRATDTFHILDAPAIDSDVLTSRFFVSGVRHIDSADEALSSVCAGDTLKLELDETNSSNPKAVLINLVDGRRVGYVPDWLCTDVHDRIKGGWTLTAVAERVNAAAPVHVRALCRIEARRV
jgi:hypothetical protein